MGAGIPYVHSKGKKGNVIVMCPSHLVNKWKREIDTLVPDSETVILNSYLDLIDLDEKIRNKNKKKTLYMIVSKDKAKSNYDTRPVAVWNKRLKTFVCPECGQKLIKKVKGEYLDFERTDMARELKINEKCENKIRRWDNKESMWVEEECGNRLWSTLNRDEKGLKWYKLGSDGWIHEDTIDGAIDEIKFKKIKTKKEKSMLKKLIELNIKLKKGEEVDRFFRASEKFSISTYVKKYYKGEIDYLIADELHLLKGESLQGQSFDDFIKSSKKVIALTGTLLNGYADSIFYILYRTLPRVMKADGFEYNGVNEFIKEYGVYKKVSNKDSRKTIRNQKLPGVSPVVFTKFLLENSVFLSLSDMSDGLPSYTEIPIGVYMDGRLKENYKKVEKSFKDKVGAYNGKHLMSSYLQLLSIYPDKPYDNPTLYDPITGKEVFEVPSINSDKNEYYDNKLDQYLEIVKNKVENGERVLTYISWTNKTDSAEKIKAALEKEGIKAEILRNVAPDKREEWINSKIKEGMQVMICNPILVETGLDLLDFTTIVFYQLGYNIFTMRQASRRSWRLSQEKDIEVYFLYYRETIQEKALSLMANKLKASMAIEGKFSEEGLRAMSDNTDLMSEVANSVIKGLESTINQDDFSKEDNRNNKENKREYKRIRLDYLKEPYFGGLNQKKKNSRRFFEDILKSPAKLVNML